MESAVASMLGAGFGVRVLRLYGVSKVAARQNMGEILGRLEAAGEDQPEQ